MPLPSSGSISLSQVNTELGRGATASINMNNSSLRSLFGVPSGQISMSQGRGKSNVTVNLPASLNVYGNAYPGGYAYAELLINNDGRVYYSSSQGFGQIGTWVNSTSVSGNYWVRFTQTGSYGSGNYNGSALGVWHNLGTGRYFGVAKTSFGIHGRYFTVQIASDGGGSNILSTRTNVELAAEIIF
jgi:hypothetical protein